MIELPVWLLIGIGMVWGLTNLCLWLKLCNTRVDRDTWREAWRNMNQTRIDSEARSSKMVEHYRDRLFKMYGTIQTAIVNDNEAEDKL